MSHRTVCLSYNYPRMSKQQCDGDDDDDDNELLFVDDGDGEGGQWRGG